MYIRCNVRMMHTLGLTSQPSCSDGSKLCPGTSELQQPEPMAVPWYGDIPLSWLCPNLLIVHKVSELIKTSPLCPVEGSFLSP